jgi:DNA-3-methyladenine glycosylase II
MIDTTLVTEPKKPFSFRHSLAFVCGFSPMAGEQETCGERLRKAHEIGGRAVLVDVTPRGADLLAVTLHADGPINHEDRAAALDRVRFTLSLDDDLAPFYALAEQDRAFAPIARAQLGHHHVKFPSPFEITVWAVLAQRTPMPLARAIKRALVERFGTSIDVDGARHLAFPSAARLAGAGDAALAAVVKHRIKADAIGAIAKAFTGVDESWLRDGRFGEVSDWLGNLPRIGAWSKAFVLYRGLGRMERLELAEGPIFECARAVYGPKVDVARVAARYGEHVGSWCLYLRTANLGPTPSLSLAGAGA